MTRTDYVAFNGKGVPVRIFDDAGKARRWAWRHAILHEGLHVREVITTVDERWIYTPPQPPKPQPRTREDFAIPSMTAVA